MTKKKTDHYKTLKVERDATGPEVKKAYRTRARELHPDVGGDADEMAELVRAYAVIIHPEHRKAYDESGVEPDDPPDPEEEAKKELKQLFIQAVDEMIEAGDHPGSLDIIKAIRDGCPQIRQNIIETERTMRERLEYLNSVRERLTCEKGSPLHEAILMEINECDSTIGTTANQNKMVDFMEEMLDAAAYRADEIAIPSGLAGLGRGLDLGF